MLALHGWRSADDTMLEQQTAYAQMVAAVVSSGDQPLDQDTRSSA